MRQRIVLIFFLLLSLNVFSQDNSLRYSQIVQLKANLKTVSSPSLKAQYLIKIGNLYWESDSIEQAIESFSQALNSLGNTKNYTALQELNTYLGFLYAQKQQYSTAEEYFAKSVKYARKLNSKLTLSQALLNLANVQKNQGKYRIAIQNYEEAISLAFDSDNLEIVKKAYTNIALCYKALGDQTRYLKYFNLSVAIDKKIKDQIIRKKEQEALRQAQLARQRQLMLEVQQYRTKVVEDSLKYAQQLNEQNKMKIALLEKEAKLKELQMKQREAELKKKEAEIRAKQTIIFSLVILLVIIGITSFVMYSLYKQKKRAYAELERLNAELRTMNEELEKKNKVIEAQKKELEKKNKQIRDSIEYASRIQRAILPSQAAIMASFPAGAFIFYLPRDVVSGDFYWFSQQGKYNFLALVDCTGHSVPGAFMSLIGNTLLNEIINTKKIYDPAEALMELHRAVIKLLHQKVPGKETVYDGMDIALLRFDLEENQLTIASANQPTFIFYENGQFQQIDGDIYSIGGLSERFKVKFKNVTVQLENNTAIYLTSDGYFDQFNHENKRKFSRKRFVKMLKDIYDKPFAQQYKIVNDTFYDWKGDYRQIDDVLVIGVKYTFEQNNKKNTDNE